MSPKLDSSRRSRTGTDLRKRTVLVLLLGPELLHLLDAHIESPSLLDLLLLGVEPEPVLGEGRVGRGRGRRPEVILVKRDRQRRVGGEDELGVSLAPVLYEPHAREESEAVEHMISNQLGPARKVGRSDASSTWSSPRPGRPWTRTDQAYLDACNVNRSRGGGGVDHLGGRKGREGDVGERVRGLGDKASERAMGQIQQSAIISDLKRTLMGLKLSYVRRRSDRD